MRPASVFIMDVSGSSSSGNPEELSIYLGELEKWVKDWFGTRVPVKVKHRSGDELILLAEGYSSAFITAFYINWLWRYEKNVPYFGLAFGRIDKEVEPIDIEKWIHPLVKQARGANDNLKKQKDRESFFFRCQDDMQEMQTLINGVLRLQHVLSTHQTEAQRLVSSLYLVYGKQNAVAGLLDRSAPTVYSHFKKGNTEQILGSFRDIVQVLNSLQTNDFPEMEINLPKILEENIRTNIKDQVQNIFSL